MTANNQDFTLAAECPANPVPVMGVGSTALLGSAVRQRCHSCKHASHGFRVIGRTHHHCQHPTLTEDDMGWGSLRDWYSTCGKWEAKTLFPSLPNAGTQRPGSPDGSLATESRKPVSLE